MAPLLGYWNIRGLAQPIRLIHAYLDEPLEEKLYACGPPPEFDRSEWLKEKFNLGLDFPNLPYYVDGETKITQTLAILRYLARKHKLDPVSEEDKLRSDMVEQETVDFKRGLGRISYDPDFEILKPPYLKNLPNVLEGFSKYLGKRNWFASQDKPTYVDFIVYDTMDCHRILASECLDAFQNLKDFMDRFEELPTIQKYMQSPDFMKWPLNGDMAKFESRSSKK